MPNLEPEVKFRRQRAHIKFRFFWWGVRVEHISAPDQGVKCGWYVGKAFFYNLPQTVYR